MIKPFRFGELLARIRLRLKETVQEAPTTELTLTTGFRYPSSPGFKPSSPVLLDSLFQTWELGRGVDFYVKCDV